MSKFQKLAESLLKANQKLPSVFICDDRNAFASEVLAKKHSEKRKLNMKNISVMMLKQMHHLGLPQKISTKSKQKSK
jgi:hypothetical protein